MAQIFPIDFEEKLTMAQDDYILFSDSEDGNKIKKAQYSNLKGEKGDQWIQWPQGCQWIQWPQWPQWCQWIQWPEWPQGCKWDTWATWARVCAAAFSWNNIEFTETDGSTFALVDAKLCLKWDKWDTWCQWPQGCQWPEWPAWNWIACVTSTKAWKITTVDITCTNGCSYCFDVCDGQDGQWSGDVLWPASSTDGDLVMFDGASWKLIKDGWALTTKVFTLSSTSDTTNAQNAYDWYKAGKMAVILYSGNYYFFKWTWSNSVYFAVNEYTPLDNTNVTSLVQKTLTLGLSWTTVTTISSWNMSMTWYNVLKTWKDYSTPYTPQYDWSPATKKYVDDSVSTLMWLGKFLSLWDATTGQPISFPLSTPYTYTTWDYFLVETVSTATPPVNYKPNGSSYTGTASSTTESEELAVWDIYIYDGTNWLLQLNHGKSVSFSEIAWVPSDNACLCAALSNKADTSAIPTDNCQLSNWCWYTTCTWTVVAADLTVVSGDSGTTYTIKKASTAPGSATNTTITFVV